MNLISEMITNKKVPQRTCVVCRQVGGKRGLQRFVRTPEGGVSPDSTGKAPGRGAYLCREPACLNGALKGNQLEYVLKVRLGSEDRETLRAAIAEMLKEQSSV
ncbi:MAG: YlxR family protein [Dehalogenimonas sp.]|uniref:YlxR family protein n=1 Tax=Candidatus Dehalogenimonas loeffleri TaxID=3127115 RepID=A0ABZ2J8E9_9CHLR|nr:YlxR family protein [Dehalogenimonas sp.]